MIYHIFRDKHKVAEDKTVGSLAQVENFTERSILHHF